MKFARSGGPAVSRQMLIGGALGAPPEIARQSFVTSKQSKPGRNGYVILNELLLRAMPWGAWDALRESGARMRVTWDRAENRVVICLDSRGDRAFGRMPGWISEDVSVREALADGMISGRHPARWEANAVAGGAVVLGWSLVAYPRVIRRGLTAGDCDATLKAWS